MPEGLQQRDSHNSKQNALLYCTRSLLYAFCVSLTHRTTDLRSRSTSPLSLRSFGDPVTQTLELGDSFRRSNKNHRLQNIDHTHPWSYNSNCLVKAPWSSQGIYQKAASVLARSGWAGSPWGCSRGRCCARPTRSRSASACTPWESTSQEWRSTL